MSGKKRRPGRPLPPRPFSAPIPRGAWENIPEDSFGYLRPIGESQEDDDDESHVYHTIKEVENVRIIIRPGFTEDALSLYFERPKNFPPNGLDVVSVDSKGDHSVVTFKSDEDVERLFSKHNEKPCEFDGKIMIIEPYGGAPASGDARKKSEEQSSEMSQYEIVVGTDTIEVRNFKSDTSEDTLKFYFENGRKSGGGDIKNMTSNFEDGYVRITFEDPSVVTKVVKREHTVDQTKLTVRPFVTSKEDILVTGLSLDCSEENLQNFMEAKVKLDVSRISYNEDRRKAIVNFGKNVDFNEALPAVTNSKLYGSRVTASRVSVTHSIIIANLPEKPTEDRFRYYFENKKNNGGDVDDVILKADEGYCIVTFKESSVVQRVCSRKDSRESWKQLVVMPYHKDLGIPAEIAGLTFQVPSDVYFVEVNEDIVKFIKHNKEKDLRDELANVYARVELDKPVVISCFLSEDVKDCRKLASEWEGEVRKIWERYVEQVQVRQLAIKTEYFDDLLTVLESVVLPNPDDVLVIQRKDKSQLVLVAHESLLDETAKTLQGEIAKIENAIKVKRETKSETKTFNVWKVKYLKYLKIDTILKVGNKNLEINLDTEAGKITVKGQGDEVSETFIKILEELDSLSTKNVTLTQEKVTLLQTEETRNSINENLDISNFGTLWELEKDKLIVHGNVDDLDRMIQIITKPLGELVYKYDKPTEDLVKSPKWKDLKEKLQNKFKGFIVINDTKKDCLEVHVVDSVKDDVSDELSEVMEKNTVLTEQMGLEANVGKYIKDNLKDQIDREVAKMTDSGSKVSVNFSSNENVIIQGNSEEIKQVKKVLTQYIESIKHRTDKVKAKGIVKFMEMNKKKFQEVLQRTEKTIPCVVSQKGAGLSRSFTEKKIGPQIAKSGKLTLCATSDLPSGVKLSVFCGDITEMKTDAIVNAANEKLKHFGGLAAAIARKGGESIDKECVERIKSKGDLTAGQVFLSTAGNLQCKVIAHAVGPHWENGTSGEEVVLKKAITSCLKKCSKKKCISIAYPVLSAGIFHYPADKACLAIIQALHDYFKNNNSPIKEVSVCDINISTVKELINAVQNVCGQINTVEDVTQMVGASGASKPKWMLDGTQGAEGKHEGQDHKGSLGNIAVEVKKGTLSNERVDVIVNSTSSNLKLDQGQSSKALLEAAGRVMQDDCLANYPEGIKPGEIAVSASGALKCKKVFHLALREYKDKTAMQGLRSSVKGCLYQADKLGFNSIGFPALGTGAQKYPKEDVAREVFKCIKEFSEKKPRSSVKNVKVIIFHRDEENFEVFKAAEQQWTGRQRFSRRSDHRSHRGPTGKVIKTERGMAKFQVGSVQLMVEKGDITAESTDAIVASCNRDLDLNKGKVTAAIVKQGGQAVIDDCAQKKEEMKQNGIVVTVAGNLKCKHIVHVDTKYKTYQWKPVIKTCLQKAEALNMASIAFPALGTSVGSKPEEIADLMHDVLVDFLKDTPKSLLLVKIVVFQSDMVGPFINTLTSAITGDSGQTGARPKTGTSGGQKERGASVEEDSCSLTVYATSEELIAKAFRSLTSSVKEIWCVKNVQDPEIHSLKEKQIKGIKEAAKKANCLVEFDMDVGEVRIQGLHSEVFDIQTMVHGMLRHHDRSKFERDQAEMLYNQVEWNYIKNQMQYPFPKRDNLKIEEAYKKKEKKVKVHDKSGAEYEVDLTNMEEYCVKQPNQKFAVIRRNKISGDGISLPKHWQQMQDAQNLMLVSLPAGTPEHKKVVDEFTKSLQRTPNIIKVERIQNKTLYSQYCAKKKQIENNNPHRQDNERVLWHGTAPDAVDSINNHGFNRSYCGKNGTVYGNGVYFAVQASYSDQGYASPDPSGNKRMYRTLVLTGDYCQGQGGMRVPPAKNPSQPHVLYDSVCDSVGGPGMFIIFNDTQGYPEHIITYR